MLQVLIFLVPVRQFKMDLIKKFYNSESSSGTSQGILDKNGNILSTSNINAQELLTQDDDSDSLYGITELDIGIFHFEFSINYVIKVKTLNNTSFIVFR